MSSVLSYVLKHQPSPRGARRSLGQDYFADNQIDSLKTVHNHFSFFSGSGNENPIAIVRKNFLRADPALLILVNDKYDFQVLDSRREGFSQKVVNCCEQ